MSDKDIFSEVEQKEMEVGGHKFKSPYFIREANIIGAGFLCDYSAVAKMVPNNIKVIKFPRKKALLYINCIEYKNTDVGPYNEVAICVAIYPPGNVITRRVKSTIDLLRRHLHTYIIHLPVTTEISLIGGRDILKYPKFLADIVFRDTGTHRICTLRDAQTLDLILEMECRNVKTTHRVNPFKNITMDTYSEGSERSRGLFKVRQIENGGSILLPKASIRLGKHQISDRLKGLSIGFQLFFISSPKFEGMIWLR
jgi:hypothetical protein